MNLFAPNLHLRQRDHRERGGSLGCQRQRDPDQKGVDDGSESATAAATAADPYHADPSGERGPAHGTTAGHPNPTSTLAAAAATGGFSGPAATATTHPTHLGRGRRRRWR